MMTKSFKYFITGLIILCQSCGSDQAPSQGETEQKSITDSRLLISDDAGLSWSPIAGLPADVMVSFIDSIGKELVIATEQHHLFLSEGNQTRWKNIGQTLPNNKINALYVHENEILISVFREGLFSSMDFGQTWKAYNINLPDQRIMAIMPIGEELLVATDSGIYKSQKYRTYWTQVYEGRQVVSFNASASKIIAGCTAGILLSEDQGNNWQLIHENGAIHNTALIDNTIFAMYISSDLFCSSDWGQTWTKAAYSPSERSYIYEVVKAGEAFLMSNNYGIHRSFDQGKTWTLDYPNQTNLFFDLFELNGAVYGGLR